MGRASPAGFLPQPPSIHQSMHLARRKPQLRDNPPALSIADAPVLQQDLDYGSGLLQGLDDGSIERVNDSDSSTLPATEALLTAKISNIEQLAFCIQARIGGHFAEWKISEVFTSKLRTYRPPFYPSRPCAETYSSPHVESISTP